MSRPKDQAPPSDGELRALLDSPDVGRVVGPSMAAVRAIVLSLAEHARDQPHILPALELLHELARLTAYLRLVTAVGTVTEFDPGRTFEELRILLAAIPREDAGRTLGEARLVLADLVRRDGNRTVVDTGRVVREVLAVVDRAAARYVDEEATKDKRRTILLSVGREVMGVTGVFPPERILDGALVSAATGPGQPKTGVEPPEFKHVALQDLLLALGYDVKNVYDYLPKKRTRSRTRIKTASKLGKSRKKRHRTET
ncbi:MAG: hypothetical protein ACLQVI_15420 [Polyangiaceae bacterium]